MEFQPGCPGVVPSGRRNRKRPADPQYYELELCQTHQRSGAWAACGLSVGAGQDVATEFHKSRNSVATGWAVESRPPGFFQNPSFLSWSRVGLGKIGTQVWPEVFRA